MRESFAPRTLGFARPSRRARFGGRSSLPMADGTRLLFGDCAARSAVSCDVSSTTMGASVLLDTRAHRDPRRRVFFGAAERARLARNEPRSMRLERHRREHTLVRACRLPSMASFARTLVVRSATTLSAARACPPHAASSARPHARQLFLDRPPRASRRASRAPDRDEPPGAPHRHRCRATPHARAPHSGRAPPTQHRGGSCALEPLRRACASLPREHGSLVDASTGATDPFELRLRRRAAPPRHAAPRTVLPAAPHRPTPAARPRAVVRPGACSSTTRRTVRSADSSARAASARRVRAASSPARSIAARASSSRASPPTARFERLLLCALGLHAGALVRGARERHVPRGIDLVARDRFEGRRRLRDLGHGLRLGHERHGDRTEPVQPRHVRACRLDQRELALHRAFRFDGGRLLFTQDAERFETPRAAGPTPPPVLRAIRRAAPHGVVLRAQRPRPA